MKRIISLSGEWQFFLDGERSFSGEKCPSAELFGDTISLPNTVSFSKKGPVNTDKETGCLTDHYKFEGYSWYRRSIRLPYEEERYRYILTFERSRISSVWVDGVYVGTCDSFIAAHTYDITPYIHSEAPTIVVRVSNVDYKVPGGHLTSPDTQTNWNGLLGELSVAVFEGAALLSVQSTCDYEKKCAKLGVEIDAWQATDATLTISSRLCRLKPELMMPDADLSAVRALSAINPADRLTESMLDELLLYAPGEDTEEFPVSLAGGTNQISIEYDLSTTCALWSEENPWVYRITVSLGNDNAHTIWFGLKQFAADGSYFTINGRRTFLRGKHDGMIFPLTGFAPMNVAGWLTVMKTARDFGINHYRFHTCCPPEAAFIAADLLGIYMQPELPFWGTFSGPNDPDYNETAQLFLREEGFRMLRSFASHPSYCMMSMGNELWGNPSAINDLLGEYKAVRPEILFTQGSNNFQWVPNIQPNDDFFSGVRFTIDRQIRGSYAMCDKPLGHVQTKAPGTRFNYDEAIRPSYHSDSAVASEDGTIEIQYGTGVKRVKLTDALEELVPQIPVVSHEIGQYCTYPDFDEIDKYTGVLSAENFRIFKRRLDEKGLLSHAKDFFENSGALAVACYKDELETALRSDRLAGFQILDIQDFSGQGTALVGVLDAFMENKGLVSAAKWRTFCSDAVVQAEFDSYLLTAGDSFHFDVSLAYFCAKALENATLICQITDETGTQMIMHNRLSLDTITDAGRHILGHFSVKIPDETPTGRVKLCVSIERAVDKGEADESDFWSPRIENEYTLWCYPADDTQETPMQRTQNPQCPSDTGTAIANTISEALSLAKEHPNVLLFLSDEENPNSIEGTYCTDFWCFPMFRSISESMGKEIPVGTLGLLIQKEHAALTKFPCETFTTPQWHSIVTASRATILDDTAIEPIVAVIDNFERNHRLGMIYEVKLSDLGCRLLVCTSDLPSLIAAGHKEARLLYDSLMGYLEDVPCSSAFQMSSDAFCKLLKA